jgi:hypothetical protein
MNKETRITREILVYSLIFLTALLLRLALLGRSPLLDSEAAWAFQAWQIHLGEQLSVGSQVGYLSFTEILFSLFGGSDFLARFWPALVGSLIVWVPFQLRKNLKEIPALLLAVGLAFDPALVSVSRIAAGPIPALIFLLLSAAAFYRGKWSWLAITLGLGLISGPAFWLGFLLLISTGFVSSLLGIFDLRQFIQNRVSLLQDKKGQLPELLNNFMIPLISFVLISSFFLRNLQGLSAWAGALPEFITGLTQFGGFQALRLLINLVVSNPFILVFGIAGFISSWRKDDRVGKAASIWFGLSLLILLLIPGRQAVDLVWLVFPLWVATARELYRIYTLVENSWPIYGLTVLVSVLFVLNWLTFTGMVFQIGNSQAVLLQIGLLLASIFLVLIALAMVSGGSTIRLWSMPAEEWHAPLKGLSLGVAGMLILYMLSALVQGGYLRQGDPRSLWSDGSGAGQIRLLQDSIYDASITQTGRGDAIQGVVVGSWDTLRWALRDLEDIEYQESLDSEKLPPLIITSELDHFLVNQEMYRGQDFVLETRPGWEGIIPEDWRSWIAFRSGPVEKEDIILWIRNDIYSGY